MTREITYRKPLTLITTNKMWKFWIKNEIGKQKKLRMFNAYIAPMFLYNCGTWALTKTIEDRLNSFHRHSLCIHPCILVRKNNQWRAISCNKTTRIERDYKIQKTNFTRSYIKTWSEQSCPKSHEEILPCTINTHKRKIKNHLGFSAKKWS